MSQDKTPVWFTCQKCFQNVKLDNTLNSYNEHISAELNLPIHSNLDNYIGSDLSNFDHYVAPCRLSESGNGANGFMVITDESDIELLSDQFRTKAALFDHLSGTSDIDHPLCDECADTLIELLEQQLALTQKDYEAYSKYYKTLQGEKDEPKLSQLEKELQEAETEEKRLLEELNALQKEEEETLKAIEEQELIAEQIKDSEDKYWKEYIKFKREYLIAEDENRSLQCQLNYVNTQLDKLKRTNVFNATFHIWHKGHFGTINNFCLGTLPSAPVSWAEINTAIGQTILLFCALARKINLTFDKFKPVPYGSHSYIEVIGENKKIPLYGSGGNKYLWDTKFDSGMIAFLHCLQQFTEKIEDLERNNKDFKFPYRISNGKIEDGPNVKYSVRTTIISEEQWTKALKYMLTDLKWGLAWVGAQFDSSGEEIPVQN